MILLTAPALTHYKQTLYKNFCELARVSVRVLNLHV